MNVADYNPEALKKIQTFKNGNPHYSRNLQALHGYYKAAWQNGMA
jgi:hypothetical protein